MSDTAKLPIEKPSKAEATPAPAPAAATETPATAPAAAADDDSDEEAPPESPETPGMMDRARALMTSKPTLQANLTKSNATILDLQSQLSTALATIETQKTELGELRTFKADLSAEVEKLEGEQSTTTAAAIDLVAQSGIDADELPAQELEQPDTLESLQKQMQATSDPVEKGKLAAKAAELRWAN